MHTQTQIIDLRAKMPRGATSMLARKYEKTPGTISKILAGKLDNPEIYAHALELAQDEKTQRIKKEQLRLSNLEKARLL